MIVVIRFNTTVATQMHLETVVGSYSDAFNLIWCMVESPTVVSWTFLSGMSPASLGWDPDFPKYVLPF